MVLFWNDILAQWTHIKRKDIEGQDLRQFFPHIAEPLISSRLSPIFEGGLPTVFSAEIHGAIFSAYTPKGRLRVQHTNAAAITSPYDDTYYAMFSIQDVTDLTDRVSAYQDLYKQTQEEMTLRLVAERQRAELQEEQVRRNVLRRFITDASHDLNTPLTNIKTALYLLQKLGKYNEKQQNQLDVLSIQSKRLETLLGEMFNMMRLDEVSHFNFEDVDIVKLVSSILEYRAEDVEEEKLSLTQSVEGEIFASADPVYLAKAINVFLDNAIAYTPEGGAIEVSVFSSDPCVIIEVADTGIGIDESMHERIFERFFRVDPARSAARGGTGLGLTIARKIINEHHGRIIVHSKPGEGSRFQIKLHQLKK